MRTSIVALVSMFTCFGAAACGDDTGGSGGGTGTGGGTTSATTTSTDATTTSTGDTTATTGDGGGGTGGSAGDGGAGGSAACVSCNAVLTEPDASPGDLCSGESEDLFDTVFSCICTMCSDECAQNACQGGAPDQDCEDCFFAACDAEISDCEADQ